MGGPQRTWAHRMCLERSSLPVARIGSAYMLFKHRVLQKNFVITVCCADCGSFVGDSLKRSSYICGAHS